MGKKANRKARAGRVLTLVPGSLSHLQHEGTNQFNDYSILQTKYAYTVDADFAALITRALKQHALSVDVLDYDATRLSNLGSRIANEISMLINLKLQDLFESHLPSVTPNDASADTPFTDPTAVGFRAALIGKFHFSDIARYISSIYTQMVQVAGSVPGEDADAVYFVPVKKSLTAATFQTLKATISSYDDGLQMARALGLGFSFATEEDFRIAPPISQYSDLGAMLTYVAPFEEDNSDVETEYLHAFDATMDIVFHQMFGISVFYDLLGLFASTGLTRTAGNIEPYVSAGLGTDECSLYGANRASTGLSSLATNSVLSSVLYNGAVGSSLDWVLEGHFSQTVSNPLTSEEAWDNNVESFIAQYARRPLVDWPKPYGLAPMPATAREAAPMYNRINAARYQEGADGTITVGGKKDPIGSSSRTDNPIGGVESLVIESDPQVRKAVNDRFGEEIMISPEEYERRITKGTTTSATGVVYR